MPYVLRHTFWEYYYKRADVLLCVRYNRNRRCNISTNINWVNIDGICFFKYFIFFSHISIFIFYIPLSTTLCDVDIIT